jgi:hypothetical protein
MREYEHEQRALADGADRLGRPLARARRMICCFGVLCLGGSYVYFSLFVF